MKPEELRINDIIKLEYRGIPCYAKVIKVIEKNNVYKVNTNEPITIVSVKVMIPKEDNKIIYESFILTEDKDYELIYGDDLVNG